MSSDTDTHHALLSALRSAQGRGQGDDAFEKAVTAAFEHVFAHLDRLNGHVSSGGPEGDERHLKPGESPTLR
jgi:hypothetical protein